MGAALNREITVTGQTQASQAYEQLRRDIIALKLAPSSKLPIRDLCARYNVAMSAVREALNRLTQDGLVRLVDQRGFTVSPVSEQDLDDLTRARQWLNETALRESIAKGSMEWEESVLLAYHRMSRTPRFSSMDDKAVNPQWDVAHRTFHASLLSACGSTWVLDFCEQLFDAADRYRSLSRTTGGSRTDDHKEICDAVIGRDVDRAVELVRSHIELTAERGRKALRELANGVTSSESTGSRTNSSDDAALASDR